MKIPFDKVYVISYIKNIEKQHIIKNYLNNVWNVNFQFIYGIDTNNLINIFDLNKINFIGDNEDITYDIGHISCAIAHYSAIQHAYENNYNSCLIIEDDAIFTDNLEYIQYCFNNIPKDADSCRFGLTCRNEYDINKYNSFWILNELYVGAQCYSINNRETMKQYLSKMNEHFKEADDNSLLLNKNVYQLKTLICKDPNCGLIIK